MEVYTLEDVLEAALTRDEFDGLLLLDLLVTGVVRYASESPEVWLAVEISSVVDKGDVSRAVHRAGYLAVPVVACESVTVGGERAAQEQNVVLLQDGRVEFWKEAVAGLGDIRLTEN